MLIELGIAGLLTLATWRAMQPKQGIMTPQMRAIFQHALSKADPPVDGPSLLKLADIFDELGLGAYSEVLRKRAALRSRSPELKAMHRAAYRKAKSSQDALQVRVAANAFEGLGMTAIAADLRNYAASLDAAQMASPLMGSTPQQTADAQAAAAAQASAAPSTDATASTPAVGDSGAVPQMASSDGSSVITQASTGDTGGSASTGVSGDFDPKDYDDFIRFGVSSEVLGPAAETPNPAEIPAPPGASTGSTVTTAPMPGSATDQTAGTPEETIAESLGMTEAQYEAYKSGQPIQNTP